MSAGIETRALPLFSRGNSTCALTTPSIVSESLPPSRAAAKASSRLGPTWAVVPAWASVWQTPHFCVNNVRPRAVSAVLVPHPEATAAKAAMATSASSGVMSFERWRMGQSAGGSLYVSPVAERPVRHRRWGRLEAIRTSLKTTRGEAGNAGEGRNVGGDADRGPLPHAARGGGEDGRERDGRRTG